MSVLKSVIITLPKGLSKAPGVVSTTELSRSVPKINFATSVFTEKSTMEAKRIPKHEDIQDESSLFKTNACVRGKKRRLDHLTWEEKLQRKKLKNRVAAQTSRDRKKAKLDELEDTVRSLKERNDMLMQECAMLRSQNESLVAETKRITKEKDVKMAEGQICSLCQARVGCTVSSLGSTAGWDSTAGIVPDANTRSCNSAEDTDHLPPFEELFGDLQGDDYIERLEELAESLLREVTAEVEANPRRTNEQVPLKEDSVKECHHSEGMVGQTPKNVEAHSSSRSMSINQPWHPVSSTGSTSITVNASTPVSIKNEVEVKQEPDTPDLDTVYGTYDEATNSITIIYPGEESDMGIQECVEEVSTDDVCLIEDSSYLTPNRYDSHQFSPAYTCTDSMSPSSIHSEDTDTGSTKTKSDANVSDGGYESHGSPSPDTHNSKPNLALSDLWHESFSELFPMLA